MTKIRCQDCYEEFNHTFTHRAHRFMLHERKGTPPNEWRPGVIAIWAGVTLYIAGAIGIIITAIRGCL